MTGCRTITYGSANQCHAPHDTAHSGQLMFQPVPHPTSLTPSSTHTATHALQNLHASVSSPQMLLYLPLEIKATCAGMLLFVLQVC